MILITTKSRLSFYDLWIWSFFLYTFSNFWYNCLTDLSYYFKLDNWFYYQEVFIMAFDGFVISNIISELNKQIIGGRIYKIYQPEADEITLVIKKERLTTRLHLSASASLPLVYLSKEGKANPMQAPNFCMLLRKHISSGRIISITQPDLELVCLIQRMLLHT